MTSGVLLVNTATGASEDARGRVVVCGSHGGSYPGCLLARVGVRGAILNDAGVGKDEAGRQALSVLERLGVPAAVADHRSARIGDAADMLRRGVVSAVNESASAIGCTIGESVESCAGKMAAVQPRAAASPVCSERRLLLETRGDGTRIWALDSASQVRPDDAGAILITGSHGGLIGGAPSAALKTRALLAVFNDAGVGADRAGIGRLDALARKQIAAATVAAATARIGDGLSTYEDGVISFVNEPAQLHGARPGQTVRELVSFFLSA